MAKQWTSIKLNQYEQNSKDSAKLGIVLVSCDGYVKAKDKASGESRFYPRPNNGDAIISIKSRCLTATDALILKEIVEQQFADEAARQVQAAMEAAKVVVAPAEIVTEEVIEAVA